MIKNLLRKHLLEYVNEAMPMDHFNDRVVDVIDNIVSVDIPEGFYIPNIPTIDQDNWIISQIQAQLKAKIQKVIDTDYPENNGVCVVVPLGIILIKSLQGKRFKVLVTVQRKTDTVKGMSYYITIYDNRIPSIILAHMNNPQTNNPNGQLKAHINNNKRGGWSINVEESFIDDSLTNVILIDMKLFNL